MTFDSNVLSGTWNIRRYLHISGNQYAKYEHLSNHVRSLR